MKNSLKILPLLLLILFAQGCEKESIIENSIEFTEYTVVRAELSAGKVFQGVRITKTLPLEDNYTIEKAEINNANAYLRINDLQVIPLHYSGLGLYKPLMNLPVQENCNYELFIEIGNKKIYSKTKTPAMPKIAGVSFYNDSVVQAEVIPKEDEVYGCTWEIINSNATVLYSASDFFNLYHDLNSTGYNQISVRSKEIPLLYRTDLYKSMLCARVYAYDKPYAEYFKSKNNNQIIDNIFSQGGGAVSWNVYGNNVIGLFIGSAVSGAIKIK